MKRVIIVFLLLAFYYASSANTPKDLTFSEDHKHAHSDHHHHSDWELGVAFGAVYLFEEKEIAPGLHLHLLKRSAHFKRFSFGVGLESVFDEHTHFNAALVGKFDLFKNFSAIVSPGILFLKHHDTWNTSFSSHFELLYEFQLGKVHLGPVLEYSYSKSDNHLMLGLHVGYSF
jgi:hypothetical protein